MRKLLPGIKRPDFKAASFMSRYMNSDTSGPESVSGSQGLGISESIEYGSEQGGRFIDFFKNLFKRKKKTDGTDTSTDHAADTTASGSTVAQPDTGAQTQTPVQNAPQAQSLWGQVTDERDYLATVPDENNSPDLLGLEKPMSGELMHRPVFETHSFVGRKEIDEKDVWNMHSFIGLRYTKLNEVTGRLERRRVKVGFGGSGSPFSTGSLLDDTNTQADMSTETPITMNKFESVVRSIGQVANNIDSQEHGQKDGEGFSGKYNVFTNNCNHFVEYMARIAGTDVPAALHDHSILGPLAAYKHLATAAEDGQQGDTRFFQGGGKKEGQMSKGNRQAFLQNYRAEAIRALGVDGIKITDDPAFGALINGLVSSAAFVADRLPDGASFSIPDTDADKASLAASLDQVATNVRAVIGYKYKVPHPRLNMSAMKIEALANVVRKNCLPERRAFSDLTAREIDFTLSTATENEGYAAEQGSLENVFLFDPSNMEVGRLKESSAEIFLSAAGINDIAGLVDSKIVGKNNIQGPADLLYSVIGSIGSSYDALKPYLTKYIAARPNIKPKQMATMITLGVLNILGLNKLSTTLGQITQLRDEDSWMLNVDSAEQAAKVESDYTNPMHYDLENFPELATMVAGMKNHLSIAGVLVDTFAAFIERIIGEQSRKEQIAI